MVMVVDWWLLSKGKERRCGRGEEGCECGRGDL